MTEFPWNAIRGKNSVYRIGSSVRAVCRNNNQMAWPSHRLAHPSIREIVETSTFGFWNCPFCHLFHHFFFLQFVSTMLCSYPAFLSSTTHGERNNNWNIRLESRMNVYVHHRFRSFNVNLHMGAKVDFQTKTGYFMSDINFSTNASRHEINAIYSIAMRIFPKPILSSAKFPGAKCSSGILVAIEQTRHDIEMLCSGL